MPNVWVTSDLHFGHAKVAELRGFTSVEAHDAELIRNIKDVVRDDDHVIFCGDLVSSNPKAGLAIVKDLPGVWHAVLGNHDKAHPMHSESLREQPRWLDSFATVQTMLKRKIHGRSVMFSHFPYCADHTAESRYMQYRLPFIEKRFLVHGHTHSATKHESAYELHVGVDAWDLAPVPYTVLQDWVAGVIENETEPGWYAA